MNNEREPSRRLPRVECPLLLVLISAISISGCSTTPPADVAIGCVPAPDVIAMTQMQRDRTPDDVVDWMELTVGAIKTWGVENCRRIRAHDKRFEP